MVATILLAVLGGTFIFSGSLVLFLGLVIADSTGVAVSSVLGGVFITVGVLLIVACTQVGRKNRYLVKNGTKVWGVIVDYEDDHSLIINGIPAYSIIVKCIIDGKTKICQLKTGRSNEIYYPIGSSIMLSYIDSNVAMVRDTVGKYEGDVNKLIML